MSRAEHQLELPELECTEVRGGRVQAHVVEPLEPICGSCTAVPGQPGAWDCDPDRPGCPLHDVPEVSREAIPAGHVWCDDCQAYGDPADGHGDTTWTEA